MNGKKWSTCPSPVSGVCNYNLYAARVKERWKLAYRTGRVAAWLAGELYDWWRQVVTFDGYRGGPRVETGTRGARRTKRSHRPPSILEIMILSLPHQPLKYKHTIPLILRCSSNRHCRRRRRRRRRRRCPVARFLFLSLLHPLSILVVLRFTTVRVTTDY